MRRRRVTPAVASVAGSCRHRAATILLLSLVVPSSASGHPQQQQQQQPRPAADADPHVSRRAGAFTHAPEHSTARVLRSSRLLLQDVVGPAALPPLPEHLAGPSTGASGHTPVKGRLLPPGASAAAGRPAAVEPGPALAPAPAAAGKGASDAPGAGSSSSSGGGGGSGGKEPGLVEQPAVLLPVVAGSAAWVARLGVPDRCIVGGSSLFWSCSVEISAAQSYFNITVPFLAPQNYTQLLLQRNVSRSQVVGYLRQALAVPSPSCCAAACCFNQLLLCDCEPSVLQVVIRFAGADEAFYLLLVKQLARSCGSQFHYGSSCPANASAVATASCLAGTLPGATSAARARGDAAAPVCRPSVAGQSDAGNSPGAGDGGSGGSGSGSSAARITVKAIEGAGS